MKITDEIKSAIEKAIEANYNTANFARKIDIHQANISRWMKKKTKSISDEAWGKLEPFIRPYMIEQHHNSTVIGVNNGAIHITDKLDTYSKVIIEELKELSKKQKIQVINNIVELKEQKK